MYFWHAGRFADGAPLYAGREARAATAAKAGLDDFIEGSGGAKANGALKATAAADGAVVVQRERIDDAAAGEDETLLALEVGDFIDERRDGAE